MNIKWFKKDDLFSISDEDFKFLATKSLEKQDRPLSLFALCLNIAYLLKESIENKAEEYLKKDDDFVEIEGDYVLRKWANKNEKT